MDGVRVGAVTGVVVLNRVGQVGLVVRRVEVDTVPAGGEEDLGTDAIRAVVVEEVGTLGPVRIAPMVGVIIYSEVNYTPVMNYFWERTKAHVAHGLVTEIRRVVGAPVGVTSDHLRKHALRISPSAMSSLNETYAQTFRERLNGLVGRTRTHQIVNVEAGGCPRKMLAHALRISCRRILR